MRDLMQALSITPRFSEVSEPSWTGNRFSGFSRCVETAKTVSDPPFPQITSLKRGVNESRRFNPPSS
jgi:hypothetical protein